MEVEGEGEKKKEKKWKKGEKERRKPGQGTSRQRILSIMAGNIGRGCVCVVEWSCVTFEKTDTETFSDATIIAWCGTVLGVGKE